MSESVPSDPPVPVLGAYRLDDRAEIAAVLRQLIDGQVPVTMSDRSGVSLVTALWAADESGRRLVLSADPTKPEVQALVLAGEGEATAYLDNVKLQFDLDDLVLVHGRGASAFNARYPTEAYRFQKRDSFRVQPLSHTRPTARFALPGGPSLQARVLDLSHGGIAILWPAGLPVPALGDVLEARPLQVDPHTGVACSIRVVHIGASGAQGVRLGCEISGLTPDDARVLQRYIDHTQRRQHMLVL
jgi:c-di-GMP-binding flagellar brake protein YcgR